MASSVAVPQHDWTMADEPWSRLSTRHPPTEMRWDGHPPGRVVADTLRVALLLTPSALPLSGFALH